MAALMQRVKGIFARNPAQGVGAVPVQQQQVFQQQPVLRPQPIIQQQPQYMQQPAQVMQQPQYIPQPQYVQQPPPQYVQPQPQYVQQPPQYPQPQPQYVQQPPSQYTQQPSPAYFHQQPQYVQQPPQYAQQPAQSAPSYPSAGPFPNHFMSSPPPGSLHNQDPSMYAKNVSLANTTGLPLPEIERFRSEFTSYANPNGVIDRDGFRRIFIASMLNMTWQDIERESEASFRRFDTNQTGILDFDEYVMACARLSPSAAQQPAPYQY